MERPSGLPLAAGVSIALIGYTSSFAVVLAGLRAVGATRAEAASGLVVLCLATGLGTLWLSVRHRAPITLAWSTPGAAALVSTGHVSGGWPAAVGAFLLAGVLIVLSGSWPRLGALITAIPAPIAQALLAGVLVEICLVPVRGLPAHPAAIVGIVLTWLIATRLAPRWATPAAFAALLVVAGVLSAHHGVHGPAWPHPAWTTPRPSLAALVGLAVPLFVVTMAGQNVPGVAIMRSFGWEIPWREAMTVTGVETILGAPFGGHAANLAAISAAVPASAQAHADPRRRWPAAAAFGASFVVLAAVSTALTTYLAVAPAAVVGTVAGVGLLATLGASLHAAFDEPDSRLPAAVTFVVAASDTTIAGVAAPAWALAAGLVVWGALRGRRVPAAR